MLEILPGVQVLERGWLSANNIVFAAPSGGCAAVVDTGYGSHAAQTVALVESALQGSPLALLVNTHLHSDHCGGNAALQAHYPGLRTLVPPGHADRARAWDTEALGYAPTGQICPRFRVDGVLQPGTELLLGDRPWQVHAAPGHDPHSVVLFEPHSRTLLSADALWESGFGVVFPELEGESAFAEVAATLDLIESLAPVTVVPGHGPVFTDATKALDVARRRLAGFVADPERHGRYAAKVLLKFKLLELQAATRRQLHDWTAAASYFETLRCRWAPDVSLPDWVDGLLTDLQRSGAAQVEGERVRNA